ncbi:succinate dehydrogenase assembly factor 2 [Emcibacter nanhaiensis]|uniref:FAD assembly factor SdhE n=1 Tax=Emcibacter nanhaiensis TaxID=1505037 RepID=A0A501PS31_9PROT|nr:succinate dehydrogenase assembly factor 2 [Emcibacter nanhaiensis]TPD62596.1 succinate dehydrogenase assembly factor 2 [Emcibacter nanhaiensis]
MSRLDAPGFNEPEIDKSESIEIRRKRLKFRSWHRGIKEADLLLGNFADSHLDDLNAAQLDIYEDLLREADSDLVAWITSDREPPEHLNHEIMQLLRGMDYLKIVK